MTIYSTQLAAIRVDEGNTEVLYHVDPGEVAILRDISLQCVNPGSTVAANVWVATGTTAIEIMRPQGNSTPAPEQWQGRTVLPAGQELRLTASTGNWRIIVSGYLLRSVTG